jgi:membrane-bound metal-dependent hydrolase YbcI (DUF457 family)
MDNLTHTLIGINLSNAGFSKRFGHGTTLILAIASNLPDIDLILRFIKNNDFFLYRRMLTHSLLGIAIIALISTFLFKIKYKHIPLKNIFLLCLIGITVHIFFDLVNSYGVVLFYPFGMKRYELAWIFIIDPVLWVLLLLPLLLSFIKSRWTDLIVLSRTSLIGICLYVILCAIAHAKSENILNRITMDQGIRPEFSYIFPEIFGPHHFRGVLKQNGKYRIYLIHVLTGKYELKGVFPTEEDSPVVKRIRKTKTAQKIEWFFKAPVWKTIKTDRIANITEVKVFDLRFISSLITWESPPFIFQFRVSEEGVKELRE